MRLAGPTLAPLVLALLALLVGCQAEGSASARPGPDAEASVDRPRVPAREVESEAIERAEGKVWLDGRPYSGFVVDRHDGRPILREGYVDGLAEGWHEAWYEDGQRRHRKYYEAGLREGEHRGWHRSGELRFRRQYARGLAHGEHQVFQLGERMTEDKRFVEGREQGRQRGWNGAGELVMNYTVKDGRRYGIVGRNDCVTVNEP